LIAVNQQACSTRTKENTMSNITFRFIANQADKGIVFTPAADSSNPMAPGNFAGWSSPSCRLTDSNVLAELAEDGGQWIGSVHMLPEGVVNMTATYFPVRGAVDNIQLAGALMTGQSESAVAVVGGGGKYAGAKGQARCVVAMSDKDTPIYRYEVSFSL
jgi:hypothetical protein